MIKIMLQLHDFQSQEQTKTFCNNSYYMILAVRFLLYENLVKIPYFLELFVFLKG